MLKPEYTGQFKKDYKLAIKRGCNPQLLTNVIELLVNEKDFVIPSPLEINYET